MKKSIYCLFFCLGLFACGGSSVENSTQTIPSVISTDSSLNKDSLEVVNGSANKDGLGGHIPHSVPIK